MTGSFSSSPHFRHLAFALLRHSAFILFPLPHPGRDRDCDGQNCVQYAIDPGPSTLPKSDY
jgi:hypothetical protein